MPAVMTDFVNKGTTEGLDTTCVEDIPIPDFSYSGIENR
jgi:hypothetical protein